MISQSPKILLLDEDMDTLERLQTTLQREGYQVRVAADGRAALRLIETSPPDLIVSNLLLAGVDGYEVWRAVRANRALPRIPILVISALTVPPNNEAWRPTANAEWQLLSYDAVLTKPIDLARFVRIVKKLLQPEQTTDIPDGPSTILAIEDEPFRNDLLHILQRHNFGVRTSKTMDKVLQLAKATPPAALIVDYRAPAEATRAMVAQAKNIIPNTPLILVVEPIQPISPDLQAQCHGFLTPPLHPIHTITHLNQILDLHSMAQRTEVLSQQLIGTSRDLLDVEQQLQAQNEELEHINTNLREIDSQRERLTSMTVHDLKSPLGSILGTLNFLLTDPDLNLSDINQNLLNGAMAAGNQMLRMIETMMDRYRLDTGQFEAYQEPFDINTILDVGIEKVESFLTLHSLELNKVMADRLPLAYADANITERILENLLDNAIKYAPASSTITLAVAPEQQFIKISVTDEGPGIPDSDREDIFERLAALKGDKSARTGFVPGLLFCYLATQAMGGRIAIESNGQIGAKFNIWLPTYQE